MRVRLFLALLAGFLALTAGNPIAARAAAFAPPARYLTASLQPTSDKDFGKAQVEAADTAGFNSIRVIMPWTYPGQADVINDAPRICSLAAEASGRHMALFLDLVPPSGKIPRPPTTASQITKYDKTLYDYMMHLVGPNGCAPGLAELDIQVANEPNYSVFWPQANAPEEYTHLAIRTYKYVHRMAEQAGLSVPVKVVVGELASSHDMKAFLDRMRVEAQKWNYHGPFFDMFSYHCYGTDDSQQPTPPDNLEDWLVADFGQAVPLLCTEYAVSTTAKQPASADPLAVRSESRQAVQFCQTVSMVKNKGLAGFGWFRLFDDPSGALTGLYYYDPALGLQGHQPVAKSSLTAASQCLAAA